MASDTFQQRACRCLNVRISPATVPPGSTPPRAGAADSSYAPVYVKDDGIAVAHTQVTVRLVSKPEPVPGTAKHSRYTTLTCLFCDLAVYRVYHEVSLEVEGNDAPLFPSENWVEHEVMKSPNGWIEVHKDCIVGDKISEAESSSSYTSSFSLVLPPPVSPLSAPLELSQEDEDDVLPKKQTSDEPAREYLSNLRPLFLPPPFTPSHPVFHHISGIAGNESQELRAEAEQRIAEFVKAQEAELEVKEKKLKENVEVLWKNFKHNLDRAQGERGRSTSQSHARSTTQAANGISSPAPTSASMTIKTFIPERVSASSQHHPSATPRVSALSASLATSKFHHPAYRSEGTASSTTSTPSPQSPQSPAQSLSSTLVNPNHRGNGSNVLQFNRVVDDNINTQASYRFFFMEEQMQQHKQKRKEGMKKDQGEAGKVQVTNEGSTSSEDSKAKADKRSDPAKAEGSHSPSNKDSESGDATSLRGRDKGKRKVTFDVEPAVVDANEAEDEQTDESDEDDAMIFSLEDLDEDDDAPKNTRPKQTLPLLEAPPSRPPRERRINSGIETFNALRPSSLPAPSHVRPIRSHPGVDASSRLVLKKPVKRVSRESAASSVPTPVSENDAAILKLVAADTPSHRGAWNREGKAWQTLTSRRESHDTDEERDVIPEEGDDEATTGRPTNILGSKRMFTTYQMTSPAEGIPKSLPVTIRMHQVAKQPLSLASYRAPGIEPPTTSSAQEASDGPSSPGSSSKKPPTSAAIRKAIYAERDRSRSMDPGFLDFTSERDEDEEDEDQEDEATKSDDAGEKARKQALKILQARSEVPTESMWRSLA